MLVGNNLGTFVKQEKAKCLIINYLAFYLVPRAGIEPARLAALVFETNASTNSAIWATFQNCERKDTFIFKIHKPLLIL